MISALMEYNNYLGAPRRRCGHHAAWGEAVRTLVLLMAPPSHIWQKSCGPRWRSL